MKKGGTGLHKAIREINLVYKGLIVQVSSKVHGLGDSVELVPQ